MTEQTKAIIDFAYDDNGKEFRDALYAEINDRVMAHIETHKQEIASSLINPVEEPTGENA
jgi:hypothetical protein